MHLTTTGVTSRGQCISGTLNRLFDYLILYVLWSKCILPSINYTAQQVFAEDLSNKVTSNPIMSLAIFLTFSTKKGSSPKEKISDNVLPFTMCQ